MSEYLVSLRQSQEFQTACKLIGEQAPVVPGHKVSPDNTELWKAQSHMKDGFDLCLALFAGQVNEAE